MITGFRWHIGGAQKFHGVVPHLSAFGKALGNGFAVSALAVKRTSCGSAAWSMIAIGVFLLSTTHGAETHSSAAAIETIRIYDEQDVVGFLWQQGEFLRRLIDRSIAENRLEGFFEVRAAPVLGCLTRDGDYALSQEFRTLFMQEMIRRGVLAPSFVVSFSHGDEDIEQTAEAVSEALVVYRKALDEGVDKYLEGRPVKPVFRRRN